MSMSEALSLLYLIKLYYTKALSDQALVTGPGLNSPLEAKNPSVFCGSATTFQDLSRHFSKDILMANMDTKMCLSSLIIRKFKLKTQ